jgi:predicted PurR-regulated permease PerM
MTPSRQAVFWTCVLGVLVLSLWVLSGMLLPFVVGMAVGYLLDPVVDRMARWGISRAAAAGVLVLGSYALGIAMLLLLTPLVAEQAFRLVARLPAYVASLYDLAAPFLLRAAAAAGIGDSANLAQTLTGAAEQVAGPMTALARGLLGQGLAFINLLLLLAITPLVAFYLLRDWPRILAEVDGWLPRRHAGTIRAQARAVDHVLAGFARGTAMVCLTLGLFYAVALSLIGLDSGLFIGLAAGAVSFVPYVGTAFGLLTSVGVALYQFWPRWPMVTVVLAVFVTGQFLSDYVLTPRLVGNRVGLHPLWVIFGVLAGGELCGFVGVLLAVPACAVIGVLARFAIEQYRASSLYRGADDGG